MIYMRPMTIILSLAATLILCYVSAYADEPPVFTTSPAQGPNGTIYAAYNDTLFAFDADENPLWACSVGAVINSSPVVGKRDIVFVLNGTDSLTAVTPEGAVDWMLSGIAPSARTIALCPESMLFTGGSDGVSSFSYRGFGYWRWDSVREGDDNAYVSIAYDGTIYVTGTTNTYLYAIEFDGTQRWEMESPSGEPFSAPAIDNEDMVYVTCGGELLKITPDNTVAWTCAGVNGSTLCGSPVIGEDNTVYVTDEDGLMHVITSNGEVITTIPVGASCTPEPLLGNDGMVYQCATNGDIHRIDPAAGDVTAVGAVNGSVLASPIITSASTLCFGVHEGALVTVDIEASGYDERAPWPCYGADSRNSRHMENLPLGSLSGTIVFDGIDVPVINAHISLSPGEHATTTDNDGRYTLSQLSPGTYTVTIEAFGMMPVTIEDVVVAAWEETVVNLTPTADRKYLRWRFTGGYGYMAGGPAVADDGTIYIGDNLGTMHALDANGKVLWKYEAELLPTDPVLFDTGIVFGSGDTVYMLDRTGAVQWTYSAEYTVYTPVMAPDGTVVFCCSDGTVRALNENGTLRWSSPLPHPSRYQPAIGSDGTIYVSADAGMVIALDSFGAEKWTYTCPGNIIGPLSLDNEGLLYLCTYGGCMALNLTGEMEWSYIQENTSTSPVIGTDGVVYFGAREALCAVRSGRLVWQYTMTDRETVVAAPVVGADGFVYFSTNKGNVRALTFEGYLTWLYNPPGMPPALKLTPEGLLLFGGQSGCLYAVQTRSYGYQEDAPWPCKGKDNRNTAVMVPGDNLARITGTVLSAVDDTPLRGIPITAAPGDIVTMTDSHGRYELFVPAPGTYSIVAEAPDWLPSTVDGIDVNAGGEVTVDLVLTSSGIWTRWRTYIGEATDSYTSYAPAITEDGTAYISSRDVMTVVQPDGVITWQADSGYACTPVIADDGTVYTSQHSTLMAYDQAGMELWSLDTTSMYATLATPAIAYDGTIYAGNNQEKDNNIRAISSSGDLLWECNVGNHTYSPPIVGLDGAIYSGGQGRGLHALTPEGKVKWTYGISFDWIDSPPAIGPDNTIYCVQKSGLVHAINPDGTEKWTYKTQQEAISSPIIGPDNTLYFIDGTGELFAIAPDGTIAWKLRGLLEKATPVIDADGILYAPAPEGTIVAIDKGTILWSYEVGSIPAADIKLGPDGIMYAFCMDGYLYAIQTESSGYPREACWPCIFGSNRNLNRLYDGNGGGTVSGTITSDPDGDAIENVLVVLEPGGLSTSTSADGSFTLRDVEPGTYTLTASAFGIITKHINGLTVESGRTTVTDFQVETDDYSLKWTFDTYRNDESPLEGAIYYSVALGHDGTIYVDNEFNLFAVSPEGVELWMARLENRGGCISVAADSTIYAGTEGGLLQAFSPGGIELWRYNTGGDISGTPSIGPDGRIYINSGINTFNCLEPDGTEAWTAPLNHVGNTVAIAYDGTLYSGTNVYTIFALSPEGEVQWKSNARGNPPSLGRDGTIYAADRATFRAISPDGVELWTYKADKRIPSSCAIDSGNNIYFGDIAGTFHALDYEGRVLWKYDAGGMITSTPAIGSDGIIYFGDSNGIFHALNSDGTVKWTYRTGSAIDGSPAIAEDGTVYIGSFDSILYAFQTTSYGYQDGAPWPCYCHDNQRTSNMNIPPTVDVKDAVLPKTLSLLPVQPNPFNMSATIPFTVPSDGHVTLVVYNLTGQRVRTLVDGRIIAGTHRVVWDGHDDDGSIVAAGVYISRLEAMGTVVTGKMVLVK